MRNWTNKKSMEQKEFKQYTPEQEEKIALLRKQAELEKFNRKKENSNAYRRAFPTGPLDAGENCTVTMQGITIIGQVTAVRKLRSGDIRYDVMTPMGELINLGQFKVKRRYKQDLSHVKIPEALKKISTPDLLSMLNSYRICGYSDESHWVRFTDSEIKAELANRPHIPNKRERKVIRKWQTDRKNWLAKH